MLRLAIEAGPATGGDDQLAVALRLAADVLDGKKMYDPNVFGPADHEDDDGESES